LRATARWRRSDAASHLRIEERELEARGARDGDGFESGMDAEGRKDTFEVVLDRVVTHVKLCGNLLVRAPLLQQSQHLDLTGGEMRVRRCGCLLGASLEQPEDADHAFTAPERTELISTATRVPTFETRTAVASVAGAVPSTFCENSSRARRESSGATTEVKRRPRTSPRRRSAAGLIQRMIPVVSRT
jgi:hypothetical protein